MSKYIRIYEALCPDDAIARDDPRRGEIIAEMRAIHQAKTDDDAVAVVAWWNAWPNPQHQTALEFVQAARKMMPNVQVRRQTVTTESKTMNKADTVIFRGSHIGVAGTTDVHVRKMDDGTFKARCGIAIMGSTNMDEAEFEACGHNPFHPEFRDNWAEGDGATEDEALAALKADMHQTADSLWAV